MAIRITVVCAILLALAGFSLRGFAEEVARNAPHGESAQRAGSQEPNAAPIYRKAASLLTQLPEDFQAQATQIINDGWKDNDEVMRNLLTANQEAIKEFKRASQLERCQFTLNPPPKKDVRTASMGERSQTRATSPGGRQMVGNGTAIGYGVGELSRGVELCRSLG